MKNHYALLCSVLVFTACSGSDTTDTTDNGSDSDQNNGTDNDNGTDDDANTACTPGAVQCASDGISVQTCAADGSGFGAAVGCNGTTCASGACTTCAVGDTSCEPPCTAGTRRCTPSYRVEECNATGGWTPNVDICPNACANGVCYGHCRPGQAPSCCEDTLDPEGQPIVVCDSGLYGQCYEGPNCHSHITRAYVRGCGDDGEFSVIQDCITAAWAGEPDTPMEFMQFQCGTCNVSGSSYNGQLTCQNQATNTCGPNTQSSN